MKKYNSVTAVAFTVHHDDPVSATPEELIEALLQRYLSLANTLAIGAEEELQEIFWPLEDTVDENGVPP
jgi:hypothetical protein